MRKVIIALSITVAAVSQAQVYTPVKSSDGNRSSEVVQAPLSSFDMLSLGRDIGALFSAELGFGDQFGFGLWHGLDQKTMFNTTFDLVWTEMHVNWMFLRRPNNTIGLSVGTLRARTSIADLEWTEYGFVGSTVLNPNAVEHSKWTLGYNVARLVGAKGSRGAPPHAWAYGGSVAYEFDSTWGANAFVYVIDLTSAGSKEVVRLGASVTYRF